MQGRFPYKQLNSEIRSASRSTSRLPGLPPGNLARQGFPAVFFLLFLGGGLPDVYQGNFLREKPTGFSLFFAFSARFKACKGRYAVIVS